MEEKSISPHSEKNEGSQAFEALYAEAYQPLFRYVFSRIRERDLAEDIVQKAFLSLWQAVHQDRRALTEPYLYTIARNSLIDYYRKKKEILYAPEDPLWQGIATPEGDPLAEREVAEEHGTLEETLRTLPPLEGEALRLKFFADRTTREISQILETSEANVRQLECRGLKRLRKELIVNAHL